MTSEGNVPNPFLNLMGLWRNYLIYWIDANRNFYENAVITNEQWLKALCDPWLEAGNSQVKNGVVDFHFPFNRI
jgi:hypothetical protein